MLPLAIAGTSCAGGFAAKNFHDGFQAFVIIYFRNQPIYNCASTILFTTSTAIWAHILNIKHLNPYAFSIYPSCRTMADITRSLKGEMDNDFTDLKLRHGNFVYFLVITLVVVTVITNLYLAFHQAGLI